MSKCERATVTGITGRDYTDVTPTHRHHLDRKAAFGSLVHEVIAKHGEDCTPIPEIAERYGYQAAETLAKYRMLLTTDQILCTATDIRHEVPIKVAGISGQIDFLGDADGEDGYTHKVIADIKTGDDDETANWQLSLYGYMYEAQTETKPILLRIQLVPGKAAAVVEVQYTPQETVRKLVKEWRKKNNDNNNRK